MRKNRTMRAATLLMALTLITSCFVGGTFAKYTTSVDGTDTARVAYWGFKEDDNSVKLDNLFVYTDSGVKDKDGNVDGLIAPGTTNSKSFQFNYTGNVASGVNAPEVAYDFIVSTEGSEIDQALADNTDIQWRLNKTTQGLTTEGTWGSFETMLGAIKELSGSIDGNGVYDPDQLPQAFANGDEVYTVEWRWLFDGDKDGDALDDTVDTALGNADALNNVTVTVTITATQRDEALVVNPTP